MALVRRCRRVLAAVLVASSAVACGGDPAPSEDAAPVENPPPFAPLRIRRLLARQYVNTVRDLLGTRAAQRAIPPVDLASRGFETIGAAEIALAESGVAQYELSARAIAEAAVGDGRADLDRWIDCDSPTAADGDCLQSFVRNFGRAAWRRPLSDAEVDLYFAVGAHAAASYGSFDKGLEYAIEALIQSPRFLYQIEIGEPDPDSADRLRLTGYEIATRMSYFLLDTTPDVALLDAAEAGELTSPDGIRAAARDLLERPDAVAALEAFYDERFKLRTLVSVPKDPVLYPEFDIELAESMRQEALRLLNHIVWEEDADYRELLTASYAFVDGALAAIYGVEPPANPAAFELRELPDGQGRAGILGQAAFLAAQAHPALTSPTRRGRFIAERFLCLRIPPPPPDVVPELPEDPPGGVETMRDKLERHMDDPACSSCHSLMDPIGFALEGFDAIGRHRLDDRGLELDLSGDIADLGAFDGAAELAQLLADSPAAHDCWVRNLYRHGTAHLEVWGEFATLDALTAKFEDSGFRVKDLLVELVASDGFRYASPHDDEAENN